MKKYLPTKEQIKAQKSLHFMGDMIFQNNLWHINRHSVSWAFLIGLFCCFLPMPFQMVPGVILCVWIGANIPVSILLIWISNPFTMAPMFYATYRLGAWMLGQDTQVSTIDLSWDWLSAQLSLVWKPLLLGSITTGLTLGILAFITVRLYWRWKVSKDWSVRRQRMLQRLRS
ncbi:MAG: DUF2062 domain-containing protein [Pseudomonadales bacterium]|nr:DUF2062 domain-containing protein [Pseudomonadales bacterium]